MERTNIGRFGFPAATLLIMVTKKRNCAFETTPQKGLGGRKGFQPRGKMLGGFFRASMRMIYIRGHKEDYDEWARLGNKGWGFEDVLPYFKKSEHHDEGADDFHAQGGLLNVAKLRSPGSINEYFFEASKQLQIPYE